MKRMQYPLLIASIMAVSGHSMVASARGHEEDHNFLHGKPFAMLNQKIDVNTEAITSLNFEVNNIRTKFDTLWSRIEANTSAVSDALAKVQGLEDGMNMLSEDIDSVVSDMTSLKFQYETDLAIIRQELNGLSKLVGNLSLQLTAPANELAAKVAALEDAIATNSGDIRALTMEVTILSAHVTLMQTDITGLLSRIGVAEQQLAEQQADLDRLGTLLSGVNAQAGVTAQQESAAEFFFQDTAGDDQQGEELADFFRTVNASADSYIYVEGVAGHSGAWCSGNAAWYIDSYLANYNGAGVMLASGSWPKWSTTLDGNWTETTSSFRNFDSYQCLSSMSGWCSEWGIGGQNIAYIPNMNGSNTELINGSPATDSTLRIKVASTRAAACGF